MAFDMFPKAKTVTASKSFALNKISAVCGGQGSISGHRGTEVPVTLL